MPLIRNGYIQVSKLVPSTGAYEPIPEMSAISAHLGPKADGSVQPISSGDPGVGDTYATIYTIEISARETNKIRYVPALTDMIQFIGQVGDEHLTGEYEQIATPILSGGLIKHIRYTVIRSTQS